jgi:sugar phosphate isomerase/epimerase
MFMALNAPAIGIKNMPLPRLVTLAKDCGFEGVDFDIREAAAFAQRTSVTELKELFNEHDVRPATWNLPVRGPQTEWDVDLAELRELAKLAGSIGATRSVTWVPSWHDTRSMNENRAFHVTRFRKIAEALNIGGCALGLEFLGPKSLRNGHAHAFIHTMEDMLDLAHDIGTGDVGLLVDAYHLYASGGAFADLASVPVKDIILVHVNDALKGVPRDELPDTQRALPLETGVLDLESFMRTLAGMDYEGPVVTEPFSARLNAVAERNPKAAAMEVAAVMKKLWGSGP